MNMGCHADALKSVGNLLHFADPAKRLGRQARQVQYEVRLYWPPLLWLAFVSVLTTEWLLRRKYSLR